MTPEKQNNLTPTSDPALASASGSPSSIKIKLSDLQKNITPLPWSDSEGTFRAIATMLESRAYAAHAANVLPGLVNAVREYTKERDYQNVAACKKDQDRLEKLLLAELSRAEEVEMENEKSSESGGRTPTNSQNEN